MRLSPQHTLYCAVRTTPSTHFSLVLSLENYSIGLMAQVKVCEKVFACSPWLSCSPIIGMLSPRPTVPRSACHIASSTKKGDRKKRSMIMCKWNSTARWVTTGSELMSISEVHGRDAVCEIWPCVFTRGFGTSFCFAQLYHQYCSQRERGGTMIKVCCARHQPERTVSNWKSCERSP